MLSRWLRLRIREAFHHPNILIKLQNIFLALVLVFSISGSAQDPHFSQFWNNPLYMTPAATGIGHIEDKPVSRWMTQYRSQWANLRGSFKTFAASFDRPVDKLRGGLGVQFTNDVMANGFLTTNGLKLSYAYIKNLGDFQLSTGLALGKYWSSLDFNQFLFADMLDTAFRKDPFNMNQSVNAISYPTFDAGILISNKKGFLGLSYFNLNRPNNSFYQNPDQVLSKRLNLHAGYLFSLNDQSGIMVRTQYMRQHTARQLLLSAGYRYKTIEVGAMFRSSPPNSAILNISSAIFYANYRYRRFNLSYTFDYGIGELHKISANAHEFCLRYHVPVKSERTRNISPLQ